MAETLHRPLSWFDMPQHACIAIGIDRYRYMQPLRYALEDAREFHAAIAHLDASETGQTPEPASDQTTQPAPNGLLDFGALDAGALDLKASNGGLKLDSQNGHLNGQTNGSIAPSIATVAPFTITTPDATVPTRAHHLLLTETSPHIDNRSTYPTRDAILNALYRWTQDTVTPDQTLWCFFSGYGLEVDGVDYLLPIEGNPNRLDDTAIAIETVFEALAAAPTDRVILILDMNRPTGADRDSDIGLQTYALAKARNIPTILSCQPHQRSYETRDLRHGLFSAVLLEALRHRKCPTLESLKHYLTERVPELCDLHLQPTQTPLLAISDRVPSPWVLFGATTPTNLDRDTTGITPTLKDDPDLDSTLATDIDIDLNHDFVLAGDPTQIAPQDQDTDPSHAKPTNDPESRSLVGLGSSLMVWLGLFGSVLGLGVWLNGRVDESAIESKPPNLETPNLETPSSETPGSETPGSETPNLVTPPDANSTLSVPLSTNPNQTGSGDREDVEANASQPKTTLDNTASLDESGAVTRTDETEPSPEPNPDPNPNPIASPTSPASPASPTSPNPQASQTPGLTPALEPETIAPMYSLQASPLDAAITQARNLTPSDPGYDTREHNIKRWGTTIFEIAQSRADRGQWMTAIAAARLVPPELTSVKARADRSIQWWTQAQTNEQIIATARQLIAANQASSYWRAIERLRAIKDGQPFYDLARAQIDLWSGDMLTIAQQRATNSQPAAAIQAAQLIPRDTTAYPEAQRELDRWNSSRNPPTAPTNP